MTALDLTALIVGFGLLFRQFLTLSRELRDSDRDNAALRKNLACVQGELEGARSEERRTAAFPGLESVQSGIFS